MAGGGIVVVGAGQAGFQVAATLRAAGHAGRVRLVGAEPHPPYQRPPLSKGLLLGKTAPDRLLFRQPGYFAAQGIELDLGTVVTAIDRTAAEVVTACGRTLPYDRLVLATGTRVRPLPVPGVAHAGVRYLRTLDDALALRPAIAAARRVAMIGGGFIGLEVAAAVRLLERPVTVLEAADRLMGRVVAPVISAFYADLHRSRGVELVLDANVTAIEGDGGQVGAVVLEDNSRVLADLVVIGIGVVPNVELAEAAGLACADGILVDAQGRTEDPRIFAAGECARHPNRFAGGTARLESVQHAVDQAKVVGAALTGAPMTYDEVPWFWSDQYEVKLQMAGISRGHDLAVVRGKPTGGRFSVFYFKADRLLAADSINQPGEHLMARKLLRAQATGLTPAHVADEAFDLRSAANAGPADVRPEQ